MRSITKSKRTGYHHGDLRRSLVDAALAILSDTQRWDFSLREVARQAGVSHNAPYAHFADKHNLLAEVAVAGFEILGSRMRESAKDASNAGEALSKIGHAYAQFGEHNPAHYRLMFGPTLMGGRDGPSERVAQAAAASRSILSETIRRGAREGVFSVAADDETAIRTTTIATWSLVHGLTMLYIDGLVSAESPRDLQQLVTSVSERFRGGLARAAS